MSHDKRRNSPSAAAVHAVNVTATDTTCFDTDNDFIGCQRGNSFLDHFECGGTDQFKRFHGRILSEAGGLKCLFYSTQAVKLTASNDQTAGGIFAQPNLTHKKTRLSQKRLNREYYGNRYDMRCSADNDFADLLVLQLDDESWDIVEVDF